MATEVEGRGIKERSNLTQMNQEKTEKQKNEKQFEITDVGNT